MKNKFPVEFTVKDSPPIPRTLTRTHALYLLQGLFWVGHGEPHRGGMMEKDSSSNSPSTCCPSSTHTCKAQRNVLTLSTNLVTERQTSWSPTWSASKDWTAVDLWLVTESTYFLPFLWGGHECSEFVSVEPPHGKVVERKVCTEGEADIQVIMEELHFPIYLYTLFMQKCLSSVESRWFDFDVFQYFSIFSSIWCICSLYLEMLYGKFWLLQFSIWFIFFTIRDLNEPLSTVWKRPLPSVESVKEAACLKRRNKHQLPRLNCKATIKSEAKFYNKNRAITVKLSRIFMARGLWVVLFPDLRQLALNKE